MTKRKIVKKKPAPKASVLIYTPQTICTLNVTSHISFHTGNFI